MTLASFNKLDKAAAEKLLLTCCGSLKWAGSLLNKSPFDSEKHLVTVSEKIWYHQCNEKDWLEAFSHHPKIGDTKSLAEKFASTQHLAGNEQAGVNAATEMIIETLATANKTYESKFGFIFIICATGKPATEMLQLLQDRLSNSREEELAISMGEQHKITLLRLQKIIDEADWKGLKISQLTSHVLDTTSGRPGEGITIKLKMPVGIGWQTIAQGITNKDGRVADLLPSEHYLKPGNYKMVFETGPYFSKNNIKGFYPEVEIQFTVFDDTHYHVPLLINPFGYSTYRGS